MVQSLKYTATPKNIATAKPTKIFFLSPPPMVTLITLSLSLCASANKTIKATHNLTATPYFGFRSSVASIRLLL